MSEPGGQAAPPLTKERAEALSLALASSLGTVTQAWERQMSTLLAIAALLAAMPQTAAVDPKKIGAMIHLLASKQKEPEKLRDEMSRMASFIINMAQRLREADFSSPRPAETEAPDPASGEPSA
jgi:hypothetical protein